MARDRRHRRTPVAQYVLLVLAALVVLFPVYSAFVLSLQPASKLFGFPGILLPTDPTFDTFSRAWRQGNLDTYLLNSALVAVLITGAQIVTSIFAAYAFAFLEFPFKRLVFFAFLSTLMIPAEVTIVANYETIEGLGWLNSYRGLVVPFLATAFGTFLLRQAFLGVPTDLRDAAALDGYGHLGFLRQVAVPLVRPSIAALAVFSFLSAWNQYLWPLLITTEDRYRTVQIGLKQLSSTRVDELNLVMAGTVLAALPIFIGLILFQRHLIRGLTTGAVKG
jgi:sn-glycerol 3-phosphate transport system permease protein